VGDCHVQPALLRHPDLKTLKISASRHIRARQVFVSLFSISRICLTNRAKHCFQISSTVLYVLPFYLFDTTRPSPTLSRDSDSVIQARIRLVTISTAVSTLITSYIVYACTGLSRSEIVQFLGFWPIYLEQIVKSLSLTALLFLGPLFERVIIEEGYKRYFTSPFPLVAELSTWVGYRNYLAGPFTEELLFRSLLLPLHLLTPQSPGKTIFLAPLYFGIAHVHHLYEFRLVYDRVPMLNAVLRSLFQFTYTTIFGWYASFVFMRTGSLWAVILCHTFCNWMGLPRLFGRIERRPGPVTTTGQALGPMEGDGKTNGNKVNSIRHPKRLGIQWTVAYYTLLLAGAYGFSQCLWTWTDMPEALAKLQ
jgi:prenyl protein peptidase